MSSVQAQNVLLHVDDAATTYVSKGTLLYSGGGLQMKATGKVENHGNVMVSGSATDSFKTIDASNADKTEATGGGNFVNKLNEPTAYASTNPTDAVTPPVYTYGQLYISGIPQTNITGIVDQEFRSVSHGAYQQIGMPFYDKTASTLSTELGKTFNTTRGGGSDILHWENSKAQFHNLTNFATQKIGLAAAPYAYYILGGTGLDVSTQTRTVKGRPNTDSGTSITLQDGGAAGFFGPGGNGTNSYGETYKSYLQDGFDIGSGGTAWQGNYGKNWYQFSNPFLTNLDLSRIAYNEPAANGDGVNLTTIYGVRLEVSGVQYVSGAGGGSTSYKYITFGSGGVPTGDVDYMMVRPMETFAIKLKNNTAADVLNLGNLRRFNYYPRAEGTDYGVANKNASNTVKQLGVIGLDANGNEVGRTYYVVYPNAVTGHASGASTQSSAFGSDVIGTYEEAPTGGYDYNYTNSYWLYINEANENNFKGKNIKLVNYDLNKVKSYRFEIRENAALVSTGTHALSTGVGFYYKTPNGTAQQAKQGDVIPASAAEFDLYYGEPSSVVLAANETVKAGSRTLVIYNPQIDDYIVRFDPNWKKADIEVYDMSGKLVISKKAVETSRDFVIQLDSKIKNSYVVKIVSEKGDVVNTKILK
ncbi:T9SS type A sorting domain-containing protein [Chryseobacterium sp. RU37D]|uniref:T9SS type A sorting domain-containing protein n=1 Tax=Chryseobacterium sp. RU37D TaxID=1907397 RepID=UPI0015C336DA|nr:T9SS type A sorting domain-containing protein [Chryseobacterium sp. RU37D]